MSMPPTLAFKVAFLVLFAGKFAYAYTPNLRRTSNDNCPQIWVQQDDCNENETYFVIYSSEGVYQWQMSPDGGVSWQDLKNDPNYAGVNSNKLNILEASSSMKGNLYRARISNAGCSIYSDPFFYELPEIKSHPHNQWVENGSNAVFEVEPTGNNLIYQWQTNSGSHWYNIYDDNSYSGTSTNKLTVKNVSEYWQDGYKFRVNVRQQDGCPIASQEAILRIGENPCKEIKQNNIQQDISTICTGTSPGVISGTVPSGGNGELQYIWEFSTTGEDSGFNTISGANNKDYTPGNLSETTWFRRKVTSQSCAENISNTIEITVTPSVANNRIDYSGQEDGGICISSDVNTITGSLPEGGNGSYSYLWEMSTTGPEAGYSEAPGENSLQNYNPQKLAQTSWFRRKVISGSCENDRSNVLRITVNPVPTVKLSGSTTICRGQTTTLSGTFTGTGPWNVTAKIDNSTQTFTVAQNQSVFSIPVNPEKTATYTVTSITDANGCTNNQSVSITVNVIQDLEWTGSQDTNWNNAANWSCNRLPDLETDVLIPSGLINYPVLNSGANGLLKDLIIEEGASVSVNENWLKIAGSFSNAGIFDVANGSLAFIGSGAQTIPSGAFENNQIRNLTINNQLGVISEADIELTGVLKVENGAFETGNGITLISNEIQTALIDGSGNGEVTGTVTIQRYLDTAFGYKYFSSPFKNSTVGDFSNFINLNAAFPNFYSYNENRQDSNGNAATGWEAYTDSASALNAIEGYALNFGDSIEGPVTVSINGSVNNGHLQRSIKNNNRQYTRGFNLVGNPYPSPIDWDAPSGWTKTNIDNAIYFFTAGSTDPYTGTYTSYVNGIQSNDGKASNIIPSMQGFFVHVSASGNADYPVTGMLGMTNSVRVTDFSQAFLKQPITESRKLIRITAAFEGEKMSDPTVIYFDSNSTYGFEKDMDAHKLMNTAVNIPNFYSITPKDDRLAISAVPYPHYSGARRIPLGIQAEKGGTMTIKLKDLQNISSGTYIYLVDREKKISLNLNNNSEYKFQTQEGRHDSRFYLLFSENRITDPAVMYNEPFSVNTNNKQVLVRMNLKTGESGTLQVSSVTGQVIDVLRVSEKETVEIHNITSTGVYLISLLSGEEKFTRKILVRK